MFINFNLLFKYKKEMSMLNTFCGSQCIFSRFIFVTFVSRAPICRSIYNLTQMSSAKDVIQVPNNQ